MEKYTATDDILKESFSILPLTEDMATSISFPYAYNYAKSYFIETGELSDQMAIEANRKDYHISIELKWIRDESSAVDIAERILDQRKNLRKEVSFASAIHILEKDLSDLIQVEHFKGPSLSDVQITGISIDLDNLSVNISGVSE